MDSVQINFKWVGDYKTGKKKKKSSVHNIYVTCLNTKYWEKCLARDK